LSGYADIDFHRDAVLLPLAPSLRLRLVYHTAVDGTASLDPKRGGLGELGGGLGDARPICDGATGNASRSAMYGVDGPSVYPGTATQSPHPNKFLTRADHVRVRDQVTPQETMRRARKEYPVDYEQYQRWQNSNSTTRKAFSPLGTRAVTVHPAHPYRTATWPMTQAPKRSAEWDAFVDQIMQRDGCTRTTALQTQERPDLYSRYLGWLSTDTAQVQHGIRSATDGASKRAPSYEELVSIEMRKGASNLTVAQQRVHNLYGNRTPPSYLIEKGQDVVEKFGTPPTLSARSLWRSSKAASQRRRVDLLLVL
jgi:hypothetical protein